MKVQQQEIMFLDLTTFLPNFERRSSVSKIIVWPPLQVHDKLIKTLIVRKNAGRGERGRQMMIDDLLASGDMYEQVPF